MNFLGEAENLAFVGLALALMWLAKKIFDWRAGSVFQADREIETESNLAIAIQRAGLYLALPLALYSLITGPASGNLGSDLFWFSVYGLLLTLLLIIATFINDKFIVTNIDNIAALKSGNVAVGLVEAGSLIATGLIAQGSFSGEGGGILAGLVFFALGQLALILFAWGYPVLMRYDLMNEVRKNNTAAGLMLGGLLVALGIILSKSVAGDFSGWKAGLLDFSYAAIKGFGLLVLLTWVIDRLFLPNTDFRTEIERDQNAAALTMTAGITIALALIIAASIV
jgi:uncharacterized membrane protein YjfL (UPF0719 family)